MYGRLGWILITLYDMLDARRRGTGIAVTVALDNEQILDKAMRDAALDEMDFDCIVGLASPGQTIYVTFCADGDSSNDGFLVDFSIMRGLQPGIRALAHNTGHPVHEEQQFTVAVRSIVNGGYVHSGGKGLCNRGAW